MLKMRKQVTVGAFLLVTVAAMGICCVKQEGSKKSQRVEFSAVAAAPAQPEATSAPSLETGPQDAPTRTELLEGYAIGQPDEQHELPRVLMEISGLTDISDSEIACVQDEEGTVFFYDLERREITRKLPFAKGGDFEGLTRVGRNLYVLRSDGTLYEIEEFAASSPKIVSTNLGLPTPDNEGLCFDPVESRILVAPKSRLGKTELEKRTRAFFRYDPETRRVDSEPVVTLDLENVFDGREKLRETKRGKKRVMPSRFLPSSVSVHLKTGNYFVVSAVAHNLAVFDRQGKLTAQFPLDPSVFPQPEGLTFLPNGDLLIANEGVESRASLLRFKPKA